MRRKGSHRQVSILLLAAVLASAICASPLLAEPLVVWRQVLLKGEDPGPRLEVDSNGRVEAHVPAYLEGAGDFAFTLEAAELERLRADLARLGLLDAATLRTERAVRLRELAAAGPVPTRVGSALSHFRIAGGGEITWRGLAFEAGWLGSTELERLAELEARFTAWTRDPRRRPVADEGEAP